MTQGSRIVANLLVVILLIHMVSSCRRQETSSSAEITYRKATTEVALEAWQAEQAADIVLLLDQSGSMSKGKSPTDPAGLRATGSRALLDFVAQRSTPGIVNRFGVVNFGSRAERRHSHRLVPIRSHEDPSLQSIARKLVPMELGNTNFYEAMSMGMQLLREGGSFNERRHRALIIFTDGEPDDARSLTLDQYFAEISRLVKEQIKPAGVEVFVIGIDAAGKRWSSTVRYWNEIVGSANVFTAPNMEALRGYFNRIVQRIWQLPEVEPVVVSAGSPVDFEVEPYLANVEFHIFPSKQGLTLKIYRPNGEVVKPGQDADSPPVKHAGVFDIIEVREPEPGMWRYEVVGGAGTIEVLRNPIPWRMRLVSPGRVHPQGKPMRIVAEFKRRDGGAIKSLRDYPLALSADVYTPSGKRIPVKFLMDTAESGVYVGDPVIEAPNEPGEYRVVLKVTGGEKYHTRSEATVRVQPIPYLAVDEPEEAVVSPQPALRVRSRLLRASQPLNPAIAFTNHPDYLVIAQIASADQRFRGQAVWLSYVKQEGGVSEFVGDVPFPSTQPGRYFLVMRIAPEDKSKYPVVDLTVQEIQVRVPPEPAWRRGLLYGAGILVVLLALLALWLVSLPRMEGGTIEVFARVPTAEEAPARSTPASLPGKEPKEELAPPPAGGEEHSAEEACGSCYLGGKKWALFSVRTVGKVKGRRFFVNGVKGGSQVTVRFFQMGIPRSRKVFAGGETVIGKHTVRYIPTQ